MIWCIETHDNCSKFCDKPIIFVIFNRNNYISNSIDQNKRVYFHFENANVHCECCTMNICVFTMNICVFKMKINTFVFILKTQMFIVNAAQFGWFHSLFQCLTSFLPYTLNNERTYICTHTHTHTYIAMPTTYVKIQHIL